MKQTTKRAVVLLSGGIDSTTTLAIAIARGYKPFCLSFRYGQRHSVELDKAITVAKTLGAAEHLIIDLDLGKIGGSALTDDIAVPKNRTAGEIASEGVPVTYVPGRNTLFLSYALSWAEVMEADDIFIGVTAVDYSGYPDCRPDYIAAYEAMANLATKAGVAGNRRLHIRTPLIELSKAEIITKGLKLGVDYSLTLSCYDPNEEGLSCGKCDSCLHRKKGFSEAGVKDPTTYYN